MRLGTLQNQQYFLTSSVEELEKMLDPELFFRANRQFSDQQAGYRYR
ncbi:hypothetical protein [Mucilaginibacter auburnensis]